MKQPELGLKVTQLRQQQGLTQEQLAEYCEVSARTIQRIESGDVDPRTFTLNNLANTLEFDFNADELENESFWLALMHLSCTINFVVISLLLWSWKKDKSNKINQHGKDVLNFQITITLALFSNLFLIMATVPFAIQFFRSQGQTSLIGGGIMLLVTMPMILIGIFSFYQGTVNTGRILNDKPYHYPLSIQFLK